MTDVASFVLCIQIISEKPLTLYGTEADINKNNIVFQGYQSTIYENEMICLIERKS